MFECSFFARYVCAESKCANILNHFLLWPRLEWHKSAAGKRHVQINSDSHDWFESVPILRVRQFHAIQFNHQRKPFEIPSYKIGSSGHKSCKYMWMQWIFTNQKMQITWRMGSFHWPTDCKHLFCVYRMWKHPKKQLWQVQCAHIGYTKNRAKPGISTIRPEAWRTHNNFDDVIKKMLYIIFISHDDSGIILMSLFTNLTKWYYLHGIWII